MPRRIVTVSAERAKGSAWTTSGSHWWWMRGASTAACGSIPKSSLFRIVWTLMVMIREPPGEPATITTLPSWSTRVGAMEESGRLPGAIALAFALHEGRTGSAPRS